MISGSSPTRIRLFCLAIVCTGGYLSVGLARADETPRGLEILRNSCGGCHQQSTPGHFARISEIRKTPEGWLMTIFRMQHVHQVQIQESDRDVLIRYLANEVEFGSDDRGNWLRMAFLRSP